jgi:hypothetical protein
MHTNFSQMLLKDHLGASHLAEHNLIQWTDGPFPQIPKSEMPVAASALDGTASASQAMMAAAMHSQQHYA